MSDRWTKSEIIEELHQDYAQCIRRGERPTLQDFITKYPGHQREVRRMLESQSADGKPDTVEEISSGQSRDDNRSSPDRQPQQIGDFRILRRVGRGGMGIVYEAEQISLGRRVALKLLPPHLVMDERLLCRFEREARAVSRLHHTNIVPVYGVGESDGLHYYAMQFIEGLGIDEVVRELRLRRDGDPSGSRGWPAQLQVSRRHHARTYANAANSDRSGSGREGLTTSAGSMNADVEDPTMLITDDQDTEDDVASRSSVHWGRLSDTFSLSDIANKEAVSSGESTSSVGQAENYWQSVANIGLQVANALQYAHEQGVFHRDIKPSNLLLDTHGTTWVLDFGLAKASDQADLTASGDVVGTLRYVPPEAFDGMADARGDVYSLGLTLYEMLALRPAFSETSRKKLIRQVSTHTPRHLSRVDDSIPRDLVTIIHKSIERDPSRRYQTAGALGEDLVRFNSDRPILARRVTIFEHIFRWARRNRALATAMAAIAALLLVINIAGPIVTVLLKGAYDRANVALESESRAKQAALTAERHVRASLDLAREKQTEALNALGLATKRERALQEALYRDEMRLAGQAAFERGGIQRIRGIASAWRPDPNAPDLRDWEWYYLFGLGRLDLETIAFDDRDPRAVAWHPSESKVAIGHGDGTVEVWDMRRRRSIFTENLHQSPVLDVCWNSDGSRFASVASRDAIVRIWDPDASRQLQSFALPRRDNWSASVSFSFDDELLAANGVKQIHVWDVETGELVQRNGMPQGITQVAWSPVDMRLAASSKLDQISVWNVEDGTQLGTWPMGSRCIAWDPHGDRIAFGGYDRKIHVIHVESGDSITSETRHEAEITAIAWNTQGGRLASAGRDATLRIWAVDAHPMSARATHGAAADARIPKLAGRIAEEGLLRGHAGNVHSIDWSSDGSRLVSAAQDGVIKIWDANRLDERTSLHGTRRPVKTISWGSASEEIATSSGSWTHLWDVDLASEKSTWQGQVSAISPVRKDIAVATQGELAIRDLGSGDVLQQLTGHAQGITAIRWDAAGKRIASAGWDGKLRIWDADTGEQNALLRLSHTDREFCWSPDGLRLATIGNREVQIWNLETQSVERELVASNQLHAISWSRDGRHLATGGWGQEIEVWDPASGKVVTKFVGHTSPVKSLHWNPTGTRLASGSEDQNVRIWDLKSRIELLSLRGHREAVTSVRWSPDGVRLASGDHSGKILIWDASAGHLRERTPDALGLLDRRIEQNAQVRDLRVRAEILDRMGESAAANRDRELAASAHDSSFDALLGDPDALELLSNELMAEARQLNAARWKAWRPINMESTGGAVLHLESDHSVFVNGPNQPGEQYALTYRLRGPITGVRIDAIPDSRLPDGGSGRSPRNGNFHVARFNVAVADADGVFTDVSVSDWADNESTAPVGRRALNSLDGNRGTMWDTHPNHQSRQWAVFQLANAVESSAQSALLRIRVDSGLSQWGPHGLGRFRISFTEAENPVEMEEQFQFLEESATSGLSSLACGYALVGDFQGAVAAFAAASRSAVDHEESQAVAAIAYRFNVVDELHQLMPDDPWVAFWAAKAMGAGKSEEELNVSPRENVIADLLKIAESDPESVLPALMNAVQTSHSPDGESIRFLYEILRVSRKLLSPEHPTTVELLARLATIEEARSHDSQARGLREEEVALRMRLQGIDDPKTRSAVRALAGVQSRLGRTAEALALRLQIAESDPQEDVNETQHTAFAFAWQGDVQTYDALCQNLVASAESNSSVKSSRDFAKSLCMRPVADTNLSQRAVDLASAAHDATPKNLWSVLTLGMAKYRAGDFSASIPLLRRAAASSDARVSNLARLFLAMTLHGSGDVQAAIEELDTVQRLAIELIAKPMESPLLQHHDDLAIRLAVREAKRLIRGGSDSDATAAQGVVDRMQRQAGRRTENTLHTLRLAVSYVWLGKFRDHQSLCQRLLAEARLSNEAADGERAAKAVLIYRESTEELRKEAVSVAVAARDQLRHRPVLFTWSTLTAGMAAFRDNRDVDAIHLMEMPCDSSNRLIRGPALAFRAMAFHRRGNDRAAAEDLSKAMQIVEELPARGALEVSLSNHDEVIFWLALTEAAETLPASMVDSASDELTRIAK